MRRRRSTVLHVCVQGHWYLGVVWCVVWLTLVLVLAMLGRAKVACAASLMTEMLVLFYSDNIQCICIFI